jgi:hypothetical protein
MYGSGLSTTLGPPATLSPGQHGPRGALEALLKPVDESLCFFIRAAYAQSLVWDAHRSNCLTRTACSTYSYCLLDLLTRVLVRALDKYSTSKLVLPLPWLLACLLACCLTYPHRGNSARSALAGQGAAAEAARCPLRPALPVLPTYYDCHRAPALWPLLQVVHRPPSFCRCARRLCSRLHWVGLWLW